MDAWKINCNALCLFIGIIEYQYNEKRVLVGFTKQYRMGDRLVTIVEVRK